MNGAFVWPWILYVSETDGGRIFGCTVTHKTSELSVLLCHKQLDFKKYGKGIRHKAFCYQFT